MKKWLLSAAFIALCTPALADGYAKGQPQPIEPAPRYTPRQAPRPAPVQVPAVACHIEIAAYPIVKGPYSAGSFGSGMCKHAGAAPGPEFRFDGPCDWEDFTVIRQSVETGELQYNSVRNYRTSWGGQYSVETWGDRYGLVNGVFSEKFVNGNRIQYVSCDRMGGFEYRW